MRDVLPGVRRPFSGLRGRLLSLVLLAVAPAIGLVIYTALEHRRTAGIEAQENALGLARRASAEQDKLLDGGRQLLMALAQLPEVQRRDSRACSAILADIMKPFRRYTTALAAWPNGDVFCSATPLPGPLNLADRDYFRRVLETREFTISEFLMGRVTGKALITLSYPAIDSSGTLRAVVAVGLDLSWLNTLAVEARLPKGSTLTVRDHNGVILLRHPDGERWVGKSSADTPLFKAIHAQGESEGAAEAQGVDGLTRLYGFVLLGREHRAAHAHLSVGIPREVAFAEADRVLGRNLTGLGVVSVLVLALTWSAANLLVLRPVDALMTTMKRVSSGDLGARSGPPYGKGELGHLARSFDRMAEALQAKQAEATKAEAALREANRTLRTLIQASPLAIYTLDPAGNVLSWNAAAERIFGWSEEEVLGRPLPTVPEGKQDEFRSLIERGQGESLVGVELPRKRKDGSPVDIGLSTAPLHDENGVGGGVVVMAADITERRRAEEELQRQREILHQSEKLAAMGELLAGVAHELNNPLSVIVGRATLLHRALGDGPLAGQVERIGQAAERCARLVRNFLALARKYPPDRQWVQLNQVVREAVEIVAYPLRVDNVEVNLDLADDVPLASGDLHQLQQVVVNLVTNAHHAMRGASPPHRLSLTTGFDPGEGRVFFKVADTGPGVPPEIRSRIFEPFFTTKPPGQGTGLGLSICQGIVEGHGGSIRLESPPGQGAVFVVELPVTAAPGAKPEAPPPDALPAGGGATILVVDDEPEIAGILADMLAADGHKAETAANGALALEKLREGTWDAVVSDIKMPVLDGPGLYREVERRHPALCPRFIFITGDTLSPDTRQFLEQVGRPTLTKPFTAEEVRQAVERILKSR